MLRRAAETGDSDAARQLGDLLFGSGDDDEAWNLYLTATIFGNAQAALSMGRWHLRWNEGEVAQAWLRRAVDAGSRTAAEMLQHAQNPPQTLAEAEEHFEDTDGYPLDCAHHGLVLEKQGRLTEACAQYVEGYEAGDSYAAYRLAVLLHKQGTFDEARRWCRKAADMGYPRALTALDGTSETPATVGE
ncbi:hypothetical protein ACWD26_34860 [Streptomyces sp. NPDC002787]